MVDKNDPRLRRVAARPLPEQWRDGEPMSFLEAAQVFFPEGPFSDRGLRHAAKGGQLDRVEINGRHFTTPEAIRSMTRPRTA